MLRRGSCWRCMGRGGCLLSGLGGFGKACVVLGGE